MVITGTDEGCVSCWDLRSCREAWCHGLSDAFVAGIALLSANSSGSLTSASGAMAGGSEAAGSGAAGAAGGAALVLAVAGDGAAAVLEPRMAGRPLCTARFAAAPRCVAAAGATAAIGFEDGTCAVWDLGNGASGIVHRFGAGFGGASDAGSARGAVPGVPPGGLALDLAELEAGGSLNKLRCGTGAAVTGVWLGPAADLQGAGGSSLGTGGSGAAAGAGRLAAVIVQEDGWLTVFD